jgi:hypothetical protein
MRVVGAERESVNHLRSVRAVSSQPLPAGDVFDDSKGKLCKIDFNFHSGLCEGWSRPRRNSPEHAWTLLKRRYARATPQYTEKTLPKMLLMTRELPF